MSLVAAQGEYFLLLDQVNGRIVRWSKRGEAEELARLQGGLPADLAVGQDGTLAILDRLSAREITVISPDSQGTATLPLEGPLIERSGAVTGVFVDGDRVYAEREHGPLVLLGTTRGERLPQQEMPGRPSRDGKLLLSAGIIDAAEGSAYVAAVDKKNTEALYTTELSFKGRISRIVGLESDKAGAIYLAVAVRNAATVVACLEPARGSITGAVEMPTNTSPDEALREMTVLDDGTILLALRTEEGLAFESYRCDPAARSLVSLRLSKRLRKRAE